MSYIDPFNFLFHNEKPYSKGAKSILEEEDREILKVLEEKIHDDGDTVVARFNKEYFFNNIMLLPNVTLVCIKDIVSPYINIEKGEKSTAEEWALQLNIPTGNFCKDYVKNNELKKFFKVQL